MEWCVVFFQLVFISHKRTHKRMLTNKQSWKKWSWNGKRAKNWKKHNRDNKMANKNQTSYMYAVWSKANTLCTWSLFSINSIFLSDAWTLLFFFFIYIWITVSMYDFAIFFIAHIRFSSAFFFSQFSILYLYTLYWQLHEWTMNSYSIYNGITLNNGFQ